MECKLCEYGMDAYFPFSDGHTVTIFFCRRYKTPCTFAYRKCAIRTLNNKELIQKIERGIKIGSKRADNYE